MIDAVVLFVAALLGGAINSVAGGGSFLTFPALLLTGVPPITANATSTVALWPGSVASVGAYRHDLRWTQRTLVLSIVSLLGGILGAVVLLRTPSATFSHLIPWLLLLATTVFAFGRPLAARLRAQLGAAHESPQFVMAIAAGQFVIALYGGFFGGGIGILMLATLGLMGLDDITEANAVKTLLASCINGVSVLAFVVARVVWWPQALLMIVAAIAGGYLGAATARRLPAALVRRIVIAIGVTLTVYFFVRH